MKRKIINISVKSLSALFILLMSVYLFLMGAIILADGYHPIYPEINTKFSSTFDKDYFMNIKKGDDISDVINVLGEPLNCWDIKGDGVPAYLFSGDCKGELLTSGKKLKWGFAWIGYFVGFDKYNKVAYTHIHVFYD